MVEVLTYIGSKILEVEFVGYSSWVYAGYMAFLEHELCSVTEIRNTANLYSTNNNDLFKFQNIFLETTGIFNIGIAWMFIFQCWVLRSSISILDHFYWIVLSYMACVVMEKQTDMTQQNDDKVKRNTIDSNTIKDTHCNKIRIVYGYILNAIHS